MEPSKAYDDSFMTLLLFFISFTLSGGEQRSYLAYKWGQQSCQDQRQTLCLVSTQYEKLKIELVFVILCHWSSYILKGLCNGVQTIHFVWIFKEFNKSGSNIPKEMWNIFRRAPVQEWFKTSPWKGFSVRAVGKRWKIYSYRN